MEGLFILVCIYNYSFALILSFLIKGNGSLIQRGMAIAILIYAIVKYQNSMNYSDGYVVNSRFNKWIFFSLGILLFMFLTCFMNGGINDVARTYILSYGTRAIGCVILSYSFIRENMIHKVNKWINIFADFYTVVLTYIVVSNTSGQIVSLGIDRQTLSYAGAYAFIMHIYVNLNFDKIDQYKLLNTRLNRLINYFLMMLDLFVIFAGGGRGAIILAVISGVYFLMKNLSGINISSVIKIVVLGLVVYVGIKYASTSELTAAGFKAITTSFRGGLNDTSSMQRKDLYTQAWNFAKDAMFMGNGAGSTAYTVGFYTHNIFLDVLVEYGFIGIAVLVAILIRFFKKALFLIRVGGTAEFLVIVFLSSIVMLMFSGSFYSESAFWFSIVAMSITNEYAYDDIEIMEN